MSASILGLCARELGVEVSGFLYDTLPSAPSDPDDGPALLCCQRFPRMYW